MPLTPGELAVVTQELADGATEASMNFQLYSLEFTKELFRLQRSQTTWLHKPRTCQSMTTIWLNKSPGRYHSTR